MYIVQNFFYGLTIKDLVYAVFAVLYRDVGGIGVAEEVVHITQNLLISSYEEHTEIVWLISLQWMEWKYMTDMSICYEIGNLAIAVASDVLQGGIACIFRMTDDQASMGKKGQIVALEVNMRPCGGFTPDMIDFARSTNVYKIWADMIAFGGTDMPVGEHYYCAFAGRRDGKSFVYSHEQLMQKYQDNMRMVDRIPEALSGAMGNQMYVATFSTRDEMEKFYSDVLAVTDATNAKVQSELTKVLALGEPEAV